MSLPIAYLPNVRGEIDAAYAWYEQQHAGLGEEFATALTEHVEAIQAQPEKYDLTYRQIRAAPMRRFPYVVYYQLEPDCILLLAVQHGHRHPRNWQSRI